MAQFEEIKAILIESILLCSLLARVVRNQSFVTIFLQVMALLPTEIYLTYIISLSTIDLNQ